MKKLLLTLVIGLCLAVPAAAQVGWSADEIGIFFGLEGTQPCSAPSAPGLLQAYLMVRHPQFDVFGWECGVVVNKPASGTVMGWILNGQGALNAYEPPQFYVGLGLPLPRAQAVLVATANLFVNGSDPWTFYVRPVTRYPSIPGYAAYVNENFELLPLTSVSGSFAVKVAEIGTQCGVVANEDDTWGGVKSLYQ